MSEEAGFQIGSAEREESRIGENRRTFDPNSLVLRSCSGMKRRSPLLALLLLALLTTACGSGSGGTDARDGYYPPGQDGGVDPNIVEPLPPGTHRVVGYFPAWAVYDRGFHVADLPADELTHVNYAFIQVVDGACAHHDTYADLEKSYPGDVWDQPVRGNFNQLRILREQHPDLRVLISVGGWTLSSPFSAAASTESGRQRLASTCVDMMATYGFDGVDIDWEYPVGGGLEGNDNRPEDRQNYTLLMEEFRRQLTARQELEGRGEAFLLTIAAPAGPETLLNLDAYEISKYLDWINLMTYDFHGGWEGRTGHNAPLYAQSDDDHPDALVRSSFNIDSAVSAYLEQGVPPTKLVLGVPFYGRSWAGVGSANGGLYQSATGTGPGSWESGVLDWKDIQSRYLNNPQWTRSWDAEAQVPTLYNAVTQEFISYDDAESLLAKRAYLLERGLGGVMIWEMSADDAQNSLVEVVR